MQISKSLHRNFIPFFILLVTALIVTSCHTVRTLPAFEVKPMTALKVMRRVQREAPIYNNYESKKVSFEFDLNGNKNSVSSQLKIKRNKCIILSVRKLSLPLGRGLLAPDSIVFVNYFDKSYLSGDFTEIKKLLGIDLDYSIVQALLTADVTKLPVNDDFNKDLYAVIDSQMYRIDNPVNSKSERTNAAGNPRRINLFMKKADNSEFSDYSFWIDPQDFVVRKISLKDSKSKENIDIRYNQYQHFGRNFFPQEIVLDFVSSNQKVSFLIKLSKSSINADNDFSFSIPEKFEKAKFTGAN
jgi:hypothetical protein